VAGEFKPRDEGTEVDANPRSVCGEGFATRGRELNFFEEEVRLVEEGYLCEVFGELKQFVMSADGKLPTDRRVSVRELDSLTDGPAGDAIVNIRVISELYRRRLTVDGQNETNVDDRSSLGN
jgi:hypothetical protein